MNYRLVLDSGTWEWVLAAAAGAAFAALWPSMRRLPWILKALRAAAFMLIIAALLKPAVQRVEERVSRPRLAILVDAGPSMHSADDRGRPRIKRAVQWVLKHRWRLQERAEVTLLAAAGGSRRLSWAELKALKPVGEALEPASVFTDVLGSGAPPSRLWLLSDGAFEPGKALPDILARLRAPVDTLGVGPRQQKRSLEISGIQSPDFVFLHSRFNISAAVEANSLSGGVARVRLFKDGASLGEKRFPVRRPYEVFHATFTVPAGVLGRQSYRIEAVSSAAVPKKAGNAVRHPVREPRRGARDQDGRERAVRAARDLGVEVIRQKYRIMYLAGRPSSEYTHLRAQLKGDPNHELVSFVILRNPENVSPVADNELSLIPFPANEIFVKNLFQFDLFILENFAYWRFNLPKAYLRNLKRFVSQGGALLVIGGSNAFTKGGYQGTPLEETLPVKLWPNSDDFRPGLFRPTVAAPDNPLLQLGADAKATAGLWSALPPLDGFNRFASVRPGSSVLLAHPTAKTASGQPNPVVAVREFGRGKVMLVGTDSTWRWKLGGGRNWKISSFYGRFWSRAVQYLTGSLELKKVKFSPLPDRMPAREPAVLTFNVFDEHFRPIPGVDLDLRVLWKAPAALGDNGAQSQRTPPFYEREPGVFQIELADLAPGRHEVRVVARYRGQYWGEDKALLRWERPKAEAPLNRKRLKALADQTGGEYADLDRADAAAMLDALPPIRRRRGVIGRSAVWSWRGWFWVLAGLLLSEWLLRRRRGLM